MSSFRLISEPAADLDVIAAFEWYEGERPGLGSEFLDVLRTSGISSWSWRSFGRAVIPRSGSADADNFSLNRTADGQRRLSRGMVVAAGYFKR